ncbi:hypothetical protein AB0910_12480 [Streptomyces sp. NPDC047002]|uniref:hypothetical protein n=1 Tax=Streptomyces sp. NPDC047002 TaxID=3155475 RepID=UPI00345169BA
MAMNANQSEDRDLTQGLIERLGEQYGDRPDGFDRLMIGSLMTSNAASNPNYPPQGHSYPNYRD